MVRVARFPLFQHFAILSRGRCSASPASSFVAALLSSWKAPSAFFATWPRCTNDAQESACSLSIDALACFARPPAQRHFAGSSAAQWKAVAMATATFSVSCGDARMRPSLRFSLAESATRFSHWLALAVRESVAIPLASPPCLALLCLQALLWRAFWR